MSAEWDDLARLAKAATPGPWEVDDDDCGYASPDAPMVATPWVGGRRTHIVGSPARPHGKPLPENAEFIAAANPATILRLIEELNEARETNRRLHRRVQRAEAGVRQNVEACERAGVSFGRILARSAAEMYRHERDALAARLAAVEALAATVPARCVPVDRLRAALAAPTDTTKEN